MGAAVRRPFVLSSPGARVVGDELAGVERVEGRGVVLALGVRVAGAGPASNVVMAPRESRRELLVGGRTLVETVVLPHLTAGAVVQWAPGPGPDTDLEIEVELPAASAGLSGDGRCVTARRAGGGVTLCRLHPAPDAWDLSEPGSTGTVRVRARVRPVIGEPVTLVLAGSGDAAGAERALTAAARTRVHERRADAALHEAQRERPALHTGVPELDEALEWAKARLQGHGAAAPVGTAGSSTEAPPAGAAPGPLLAPFTPLLAPFVVLGHAAAGDHDAALAAALEIPRSEPGALVAMAWATAWVGAPTGWSAAEVVETGRKALEAARSTGSSPVDPMERIVARAAVGAAADLLAALGDRRASEALLDALPRGPVTLDDAPRGPGAEGTGRDFGGGRAMTLPVLGGAPAGEAMPNGEAGSAPDATWRAAALAGAVMGVPTRPGWSADHLGVPPPPPPRPPARSLRDHAEPEPGHSVIRALEAWAHFSRDRPEHGYLRLREHLAEAAGPDGARGCWRRGDTSDDPLATALVPVLVLHGLLGARPDAPFGRLRLAPALPASWTRFRVTGIHVGRAVVELDYRREGGRHTFVLRPTGGPLPPNLVLEPSVPGPVTRVEVDDEPSDVGTEAAGDRVRASLQIPLDRERKVSLAGPDA